MRRPREGITSPNIVVSIVTLGVVLLIAMGLGGCDISERLEGCSSRQQAVADFNLRASSHEPHSFAGLAIRLPVGVYYRQERLALTILSEPGIYCDSGDWGLTRSNYLRVRLYGKPAPQDPFVDFPHEQRGYALDQIKIGLGSFDYELEQNAVTWPVRAFLKNPFWPQASFMYLTAEAPVANEHRGIAIHDFPGQAKPRFGVLSLLLQSIEEIIRRGMPH